MASTPRRALRRAVVRQRCAVHHTAAPAAARRIHGAPHAQPPAQVQQERTTPFPHSPFTLTPSHALPAALPRPAHVTIAAVHAEIDSRFSSVAKKCKEASACYKDGSSDLLTALPAASLTMPKPTLNNPAFPAAPAATTRPFLSVVTRLSCTLNHADLVLYVL